MSLSKEKLWDLFGDHEIFSESPTTLFNCFELWSHGEGVFCYRMKPNLQEELPSEGYEERIKEDTTYHPWFKNIQICDNMERLISPEQCPIDYELKSLWVLYTHDEDGELHEVLENCSSIPEDVWRKEHEKPGFRNFVDTYLANKIL